MKLARLFPFALSVLVIALFPARAAEEKTAATPPRDSFLFDQAGKQVKVWYFQPPGATAKSPIVFVMHGVRRNGEDYLNEWIESAREKKFLLVVPEFSAAQFPGEEGYIYGNTVDAAGKAIPRAQWAFTMIEPIFDAVRKRMGNVSSTYLIFGHSAGAQFVQRFLYFMPQARYSRAVAANAGWYTLPDLNTEFPYGLKGTVVDALALRTLLARPVVVLLGTADTDPKHPSLRRTPEADVQGTYRFARGVYFFAHAKKFAADEHIPFGWTIAYAPGVAHSNKDMAPFATRALFPE
ncbi:alpha/beta hydrolase [Oleiharenicola lentus]|uniref:alpha/beta hydrolase n=1 Tax=Oleiharenicola lentus TaxID=2508720 RepID=UPI003F66FA7C